MAKKNRKLYKCEFQGHWLGGVCIIRAMNPAEAQQVVSHMAREHGLKIKAKDVEVEAISPVEDIVYFDDGVY